METVEVLVRIPKRDFEELQSNYVWWGRHGEYIKNGTVLPKNHGRLIDADEILKEKRCFEDFDGDICNIIHEETVINANTIIEANKERENVKTDNNSTGTT